MSTPRGRRLQFAAACLALVVYLSLSHYCNSTRAEGLGALLALAPPTALSLVLVWRGTAWPVALLSSVGLAAALYGIWPLTKQNFPLFDLLQETSLYCGLGLTFGRSLAARKVALCTRLADGLHGPLSPREVLYTRQVTLAWTLFFFAVAAASILLFATAPLRIWSLYINFCVPPLIGAMFVAEYGVRRRLLPQVIHTGLIDTVRVYFASQQ